MTGFLFAAHVWGAVCALILCGLLFGASHSPKFRFKIGPSERDRSFNFAVVALFLFALGMDFIAAIAKIEGASHYATVSLVCITGTVAVAKIGWRGLRWKI